MSSVSATYLLYISLSFDPGLGPVTCLANGMFTAVMGPEAFNVLEGCARKDRLALFLL